MDSTYKLALAYALVALFAFIAIRLAITTNIIRDISVIKPPEPKPYSFGRTQLLFWTLIILSCFIFNAIITGDLPKLNSTDLMLLGISLGTTTSAAMIDTNDIKRDQGRATGVVSANTRHQDRFPGKDFFTDILSDQEDNISIHRFQTLVFNIVIGVLYVSKFVGEHGKVLPDFTADSNYLLALLGISNTGYVALKAGENAKR